MEKKTYFSKVDTLKTIEYLLDGKNEQRRHLIWTDRQDIVNRIDKDIAEKMEIIKGIEKELENARKDIEMKTLWAWRDEYKRTRGTS